MGKLFWVKFNYTDFIQDTDVLSNNATGGWVRILCRMFKTQEYFVSGSIKILSRILRCDQIEAQEILTELEKHKICDVTKDHSNFTVMSRRLKKECDARENSKLRKRKQRVSQSGHDTEDRVRVRVRSKNKNIKKEEEERSEQSSSPLLLMDKFLRIVKKYPQEFKLREPEDTQWFKDKIINEPKFRDLDLSEVIDGWGTWLEAEHRGKETHKSNTFPKSDFKQSLKNRFKKALKFLDNEKHKIIPAFLRKKGKNYDPFKKI